MVKVSVIIPVYNAEQFLRDCLQSLIHQSLQDFEIICIDDKSSDASRDILYDYQKRDNRIKIICNEINLGAAESRNKGLSAAEGRYIQFVDADDYLEFDALENLYCISERYHTDMCYFGMKFDITQDRNNTVLQDSIMGEYPGVFKGRELLKCFTENKEFFLYLWSVFYRNEFIKEKGLRYKKLIIGEGGNFILRALCLAERVVVCKEKFYHYRVNAFSVTHGEKAKRELLLGQVVQYADVLQYFSVHENAEELGLFLTSLYKKIAGGIQSLSNQDKKEIETRLESSYEKHVFGMLQQKNDVYGIRFCDAILKRIREKKKVIVYGAGYATKEMLSLLQQHKIEIAGFAVTKRNQDQFNIFGHHIYEITELQSYCNEAIVLIAANRKFNREIQDVLEKNGFTDYIFLNVEI